MDVFKKKFQFSHKLLKAHFCLHFISYAFCALNYTYILSYEKKHFIITFITIQTLLLILIFQILCLLKSTKFSSLDQIKCALNIYLFISILFFILVIIQYVIIFLIFNSKNISKIIFICIGIIYYIFDSLIFIYEYHIINWQIKKTIAERISMQLSQNRNEEKNINKNETQPSEKSNKNITFIKENTTYIICEKKDKSNIEQINVNNIKNFLTDVDNSNFSDKDLSKYFDNSNNKIFIINKYVQNTNIDNSERKIYLTEGNKS